MPCSLRCRRSLAYRGMELGGRAIDVDHEFVAACLLDSSISDELTQQILCSLVVLVLPLQLQHLLLELLDHGKFRLDLSFSLSCSLLVGLDLRKCSSSLGGDLEHICRDALRDY